MFSQPKQLILKKKPDFPCLADEIAEPRTDMNISLATFTVREKSMNTMDYPKFIVSNQKE